MLSRLKLQHPVCCDASCGISLSGSKNQCAGCSGSANRRIYPFQKKSIKLQQMMAIGYRSQYLHKMKRARMGEGAPVGLSIGYACVRSSQHRLPWCPCLGKSAEYEKIPDKSSNTKPLSRSETNHEIIGRRIAANL